MNLLDMKAIAPRTDLPQCCQPGYPCWEGHAEPLEAVGGSCWTLMEGAEEAGDKAVLLSIVPC